MQRIGASGRKAVALGGAGAFESTIRSNYSHFTPLLIVTELVNRMYVMRRRLASTLRVPL